MSHPFHIVTTSPWPILCSFSSGSLLVLSYSYMVGCSSLGWMTLAFSLLGLVSLMAVWWRDVVRESTFQGLHTQEVQSGLRMGMVLFILSEVMFFFSFFLGFFYLSLSPDAFIGSSWPPVGVEAMGWLSTPLLNTVILLSSGVSVTWSHHSILLSNFSEAKMGLALTVFLGVVFLMFQWEEYLECSFTMADSSFGSVFFMATGFHGLHVLIGTLFLAVSFYRLSNFHMSPTHHFGFEASAWYWHFVDVVWLFLYLCIYWWGGS